MGSPNIQSPERRRVVIGEQPPMVRRVLGPAPPMINTNSTPPRRIIIPPSGDYNSGNNSPSRGVG